MQCAVLCNVHPGFLHQNPVWPPGRPTLQQQMKDMEAMRKTANSSSRGHRHSQQGLNDTREPYVVTEDGKGRRIGVEWEAHHR